MAHVLTTDEKNTQRLQGQWSKTYLAIPEYHTIYTARLAALPTINDMVAEISVDTESGTRANVLADMTLYVGTTAGAYDLGMCRIRKTPIEGLFYISETSDIIWSSACHLTVVDDYSLWQKSLRIIGSEPFMDWDVEYDDQHEDFDPVPVMGTHHVAKLTGASVDVQLGPSADTFAWVIDSSVASKNWSVTGATLDDDTATNPIATFDAVGTYLAYCLFTAANGKTFTGVRYIIIWDDDHPLIEHFVLSNGRGSFESGYSFDCALYSGYDAALIRKRSLVILCTEDYAENAAVTLPGQIAGAENILCVGWITDVDNNRSSEFGGVSFSVQGATYWLKQIRDYPSGLQLKIGPTEAWTDMPSLNCNRAMWHFLHWRCTASRVMDIQHTNDGRLASQFNIARANLWERLVQVTTPVIFAAPHVDNYGRLFAFIEPQMVPVASRTWPVVMELLDADIKGDIGWKRQDVNQLAMLFLSGINVNDTSSANSYFSMSPGHSYAHHGEEESLDNYLIADQASGNELCGLYYGWKNNPLSSIEFDFVHSMRVLGLFPRQYFYYEISAVNDPRGIGFEGNLIPREVNFSIDPETGFIEISATMEPESFPGPAVDGDVPTMEDVDFSTPTSPSKIPDLPDIPIIYLPPSFENLSLPSKVVVASDNFGVMYSENINNGDITKIVWKSMNAGLTLAEQHDIINLITTPSGAIYVFTGYGTVYRASAAGGTFVLLASDADFSDTNGKPTQIDSIGLNPLENDMVCIASAGSFHPGDWTPSEYWLGCIRVSNNGVLGAKGDEFYMSHYGGSILCNGDQWFVFGCKNWDASLKMFSFLVDGTADAELDIGYLVGQSAGQLFSASAGSQLLFWTWDATGAANGYDKIEAASTVSHFITPTYPRPSQNFQALAPSPTGNYILMANGSGLISLSTDFGASWIGTALSIGPTVLENCRDDNRWLFGGGANIKITLDRGATDINLIGNLPYAAPLINITHIRFLE